MMIGTFRPAFSAAPGRTMSAWTRSILPSRSESKLVSTQTRCFTICAVSANSVTGITMPSLMIGPIFPIVAIAETGAIGAGPPARP
jgi:hypothetical protein